MQTLKKQTTNALIKLEKSTKSKKLKKAIKKVLIPRFGVIALLMLGFCSISYAGDWACIQQDKYGTYYDKCAHDEAQARWVKAVQEASERRPS